MFSAIYSIIDTLGEYGFEFILDDYGTGYSNLERFAKLPIKYVKVDRGLVKLSNQNQINDALKTTFNMIHELDRISVVEGIESLDDLNKFRNYNCNYAQGSYLSNVLPENEFLDFIKDKIDNPLVV